MILGILAACGTNLPAHTELPRLGSAERHIADLPVGFEPLEVATHPTEPEWLLLTGLYGGVQRNLVVHDGIVDISCPDRGVTRLAWRNDVGLWDVHDGALVVLRGGATEVDRCVGDEVTTTTLDAVPQAFVPDGDAFVTWTTDGPERREWPDLAPQPAPWPHGPILDVAANRERTGVDVVSDEGTALVLWSVDASLSPVERLRVDAGGLDAPEVALSWDDGLILVAGADVFAATPGHERVRLDLTPDEARSRVWFPWDDDAGMSAFGTPTLSVHFGDGTVVREGFAGLAGHHVLLDGEREATQVAIHANRPGQRPGETPLWAGTVDLSTRWGDLGQEPIIEAVGTEDGTCIVAAWGTVVGLEGRRVPGGRLRGWGAADTVVFGGRCTGPLDVLARGLDTPGMVELYGGSPILKTDHFVFSAVSGTGDELPELGSYEGYDIRQHGWILGERGPVPAYEGAKGHLWERRGSVVWTWADDQLFRAEVEVR